jgi:hypothetical protein
MYRSKSAHTRHVNRQRAIASVIPGWGGVTVSIMPAGIWECAWKKLKTLTHNAVLWLIKSFHFPPLSFPFHLTKCLHPLPFRQSVVTRRGVLQASLRQLDCATIRKLLASTRITATAPVLAALLHARFRRACCAIAAASMCHRTTNWYAMNAIRRVRFVRKTLRYATVLGTNINAHTMGLAVCAPYANALNANPTTRTYTILWKL